MEQIRVRVVRAEGVLGTDGFGSNKTSDPYVVLTYLDHTGAEMKSEGRKSKHIEKTLNPEWNFESVIGNDVDLRVVESLAVNVFDKGVFNNEPLGRVVVPMTDIRVVTTGQPFQVSMPLEKFGKMKAASGTVVVEFESAAAPSSSSAVAAPAGSVGIDIPSDSSAPASSGPPNVLLVTVDSAKGLKAMDKGVSSDPIIHVVVNKVKFTTTKKEKVLAAMWNESFKIPVTDASLDVEFIVEDVDTFGNDFMGQVKVPLASFVDCQAQTLTLDLLNKKYNKEELGSITVKVQWIYHANVDDVVASNKKKGGNFLDKMVKSIGAGVPDAGDDDEDAVDIEAADTVPKKSDEELKKEKEAREKALADEKAALENINIRSGDYTVQVHVIEARDLVPKDATGTSDPVVYVQVLDQKQNTATKHQTLSAVWDDVLIFNFRNLDKEQMEMGALKLSVMDANTFERAELIGETTFDTSFVYSNMNHQICNKWIGLIAPGSDKVQGYLRVSITILGPDDKFVPPPPIGPNESGLDGVLMPPSVQQQVKFLVVKIHNGEHLPAMDQSLGKQGIDAYVECSLGGSGGNASIRTRVKTKKGERHLLNPAFNDDMYLVLREPSMASKITFKVMDWDRVGSDEVVAHAYQSISLIRSMNGELGPMWINLYGAPLQHAKENLLNKGDSIKTQMNTYPEQATTYRGRLLVSFSIQENVKELEEINQRVKARPLPPSLHPATSIFKFRAFLGTGSDIPQIPSLNPLKNSRMQVIITCGLFELAFERQHNNKGLVVWNQLIESGPVAFPMPIDGDYSQIPDVFVYLCKGGSDKMNPRKQIAFKRYTAKDLVEANMAIEPKWITLKEDPCVDALGDEAFPGNIFFNLGLAPIDVADLSKAAWVSYYDKETLEKRHKYQVRVNIFQARQLPALDDDGLSDPYAKVRFMGEEKRLKEKKKTVNPTWYETLTFDCDLPPPEFLHFSPQVVIRLMDWDNGIGDSGHDYMGSAFVSISSSDVREPDDPRPLPQPKWCGIMQQEEGDTEGAVLASVVVVKMDQPDMELPPPESIVPAVRKAYVEIIVLGLRDMRPYQFLPIQLPFIEFTLGGREHASQEMKTEKSKRPSGENPNFLQRIVREVELPEDSLFAPMLNIMVKDTRLGGWNTPTIGNASIDMTTKLPWSKGYIAPQSLDLDDIQTKVAEEDGDDDDDEASGLLNSQKGSKEDFGAGVFGALTSMNVEINLDDPALLTGSGADAALVPDEPDDESAADEYEIKRRKYMKNRDERGEPLELEVLKTRPFETYKLTIGQKKKKSGFSLFKMGSKKPPPAAESGTFHIAGIFKGLVRVMLDKDEEPLINLEKLLTPMPYQVRVYILNGENFMPMDPGLNGAPGKSDPYLVLRLGKDKINDRKNYVEDVVDPDFYKLYEFNTHFPGASTLFIDAYDYDLIGGDDLIGSTTIDLEDRFFDKNWQLLGEEFHTVNPVCRWGPKPVEQRPLHIKTSKAQMGQLKMWVDILSPKDAATYEPVDIALPPPQEYELRVVVWKTKEVPSFDELTDMNDLFVRCQLEGGDYQDTDIHWRAKKGKASFNWRMKFPVTLGHKQHNSKFPYFKMQMWDKDIFSASDCIAEGLLDMSAHFKEVCKLKAPLQIFKDKKPKKKEKETPKQADNNDTIQSIKESTGLWDINPSDSTWIKLERLNRETNVKEPMGAICISMELVPKEKAKVTPLGHGRSDPNNSPFLPPPAGRLKFSMNPFYVFNELLGPKICRRVMCCCCCLLLMLLMYFFGPIINLLIVMFK
ncbi:hypothetical protein H257_06591 [Aphanomyces astaci]|uniref:C2 domain-containing protein n=1 Tax=Aphanomyces astaci TaxID=112090 RepID=W4GKM9_APHAT|nr:hypothetical protein H257_06591 [Aphanomyces astaci]ETV80250.1 hypothetical protein H257_06591 [Aphanomyces astaci]RQM24658.1 hypothetical protein B5M09_000421 [Aphanomyces astaci]|eukprot:XP_009830174.1 hypothetical protein H257_06591 [Aphanomyces astaci]